MNHKQEILKQKTLYFVYGAVAMLLGVVIGAIVSPDSVAQSNGVFDEIICSKLIVVDNEGRGAIQLSTEEEDRFVRLYDTEGNALVALAAKPQTRALIMADRNGAPAITLMSMMDGIDNSISVRDKNGQNALAMTYIDGMGNTMMIYDAAGEPLWRAP